MGCCDSRRNFLLNVETEEKALYKLEQLEENLEILKTSLKSGYKDPNLIKEYIRVMVENGMSRENKEIYHLAVMNATALDNLDDPTGMLEDNLRKMYNNMLNIADRRFSSQIESFLKNQSQFMKKLENERDLFLFENTCFLVEFLTNTKNKLADVPRKIERISNNLLEVYIKFNGTMRDNVEAKDLKEFRIALENLVIKAANRIEKSGV